MTPAIEAKREVSDSTYLQRCEEVEQELAQTTLDCQLCHGLNDVRLLFCQGCKSLISSPNRARAEMRMLAVKVGKRLGFTFRHMTRGYLSDAQGETTSALKHGSSAAKNSYGSIVDRYNCDTGYAGQIEKRDAPDNTLIHGDTLRTSEKSAFGGLYHPA